MKLLFYHEGDVNMNHEGGGGDSRADEIIVANTVHLNICLNLPEVADGWKLPCRTTQ